jgi:hypothetical protein
MSTFLALQRADHTARTLHFHAALADGLVDLKPRLVKHADGFAKSTNGRSQGAVRLDQAAAGKVVDIRWDLSPSARSLDVVCKVVDEPTWTRVLKGDVTGLRIERDATGEISGLELATTGAASKSFDLAAGGTELRKVAFTAAALRSDDYIDDRLLVKDGTGQVSSAATLIKGLHSVGPFTLYERPPTR